MKRVRERDVLCLTPAQSRNASSWGKLRLPAMIWIVFVFCAAAAITAPAQSIFFTTLATFDGPNGGYPDGTLVEAGDGDFYGTTSWGGANLYYGTVFKMTPAGTLTTLYSFCAQPNCADGASPLAGLVQGTDGNFYGTTIAGGSPGNGCGYGSCGTVFKITPAGTLTTLHRFCPQPNCTDGANPSSLMQASDGNFYGTTSGGGTYHYGTIFKITPAGTLTTLHSFDGSDGAGPEAALVQARDGNFYGTTSGGGAYNYCDYPEDGCGTVFKITPAGVLTTLYSFCFQSGCPDGANPGAALVQGSDGNFYGTTGAGGVNFCPNTGSNGCGTVFNITPTGTLTTLYIFCEQENCPDGALPGGVLAQGSDGNFYGTTIGGGNGVGTIFKITPGGGLTTLHNFNYPTEGGGGDGLIQANDGSFYGTTHDGGPGGVGAVFRMGVVRTCAACRP